MATTKKRNFEFLVPSKVLYFITRNTARCNANQKSLLRKKSNVQKFYYDNNFTKINYEILINEQGGKFIHNLPSATQYWIKIISIFENEKIANKQRDVKKQHKVTIK